MKLLQSLTAPHSDSVISLKVFLTSEFGISYEYQSPDTHIKTNNLEVVLFTDPRFKSQVIIKKEGVEGFSLYYPAGDKTYNLPFIERNETLEALRYYSESLVTQIWTIMGVKNESVSKALNNLTKQDKPWGKGVENHLYLEKVALISSFLKGEELDQYLSYVNPYESAKTDKVSLHYEYITMLEANKKTMKRMRDLWEKSTNKEQTLTILKQMSEAMCNSPQQAVYKEQITQMIVAKITE